MWVGEPQAGVDGQGVGTGRGLSVAGGLRGGRRTVLAMVPTASVRPNPDQPRRGFGEAGLAELAASIRERGLLQPIVVKRDGAGYLLMAGERRLRAAALAGLDYLPALVREDDPLEVGLIENLQREDLSPLEEAEALATLIRRYGYTHQTLAALLGKSRPYVSNMLALTRLPEDVKREVAAAGERMPRELLMAVARQETDDQRRALWRRLRLSHLSVHGYRAAAGNQRAPQPAVSGVVLAARRLQRALASCELSSLDPACRGSLRRTLTRTQRAIGRALLELASA